MKLSPMERARLYVAKCLPAVSGQGGHDDTFHVACVLVNGFALDEADALILLREFNRRCLPPWTEAELVHKIKSAANTVHRLPLGHLLGTLEKRGGGSRQNPSRRRRRNRSSKNPCWRGSPGSWPAWRTWRAAWRSGRRWRWIGRIPPVYCGTFTLAVRAKRF